MKGERTYKVKGERLKGKGILILSFLSIFNFQFSILHAVETIVVGEIVNETTGEAIPNVNIHFRGTKIGTTSDENGSYALRVDMTGSAT